MEEGPGDPQEPNPTVAGMLYEIVVGASNAIYNTMAKVAEGLGYGELWKSILGKKFNMMIMETF
ncbi:MAG: hypothetical protein IPQ10_09780 [Saprospiraceae bacterium]|nr:hypothetical protein [Saprospiraceae bacterium]